MVDITGIQHHEAPVLNAAFMELPQFSEFYQDCSPQLRVDMLVAEFYHELQLPALQVWDDMCMEICGETAKEMDERCEPMEARQAQEHAEDLALSMYPPKPPDLPKAYHEPPPVALRISRSRCVQHTADLVRGKQELDRRRGSGKGKEQRKREQESD